MKQTINLFKGNKLSIIDWEGQLEMAHILNEEVSYDIMNDPIRFEEEELVENVNSLITEILFNDIKENITDEVEIVEGESLIVETFSYQVWIDPVYNKKTNKIEYFVSTAKLEAIAKGEEEYSELEKNKDVKKTYKGLMNYIKRFQ